MILQIDDWKFDIDMERTMEYSLSEAAEHCDCAYCRNFYTAVDQENPALRQYLAQFGLNIEAPDEQMPYDYQGKMYYDSVYMVSGRVLRMGQKPLRVGDVLISPKAAEDVQLNHCCPKPCFALDVGTVVLPWVLDEPMKDTVSPANFPSFLKKMWQRLLGKSPKDSITS